MRCREAVRQKKIFKDSTGRTPSAAQEEKDLRTALLMLEAAEMKLANTKRLIPALQKEVENYRGGVQGLGSFLAAEMPKAIATLDRLSLSLQEYIDLRSQVAAPGESSTPAPAPTGNMNRGGESADQAQPPGNPPPPPGKGGADVAG